MLLSFYHTRASKQHRDLHNRESLILSLSYTSGKFHYRTWLVYSNDGLPQMPEVFVSKQVGCTPTQFLLLIFHTFIALVHLLHGNPYSFTLISIDGHLHSLLIRLVDVGLSSPPFCLLHNHHSIPPIVLYPWLTLMYCVKIKKVLKMLKYETIAWLVIGVVHDLNILCGEDRAQPDYMILQG